MDEAFEVEIKVKEPIGLNRTNEPIAIGIPVKKGLLKEADISAFKLVNESGESLPFSLTPLLNWSDSSIRWMLLDFLVTCSSKDELKLYLKRSTDIGQQSSSLTVEDKKDFFEVNTGKVTFNIPKDKLYPISSVRINGKSICRGSQIDLFDDDDRRFSPVIRDVKIESFNKIKLVLFFKGEFKPYYKEPKVIKKEEDKHPKSKEAMEFFARLTFWQGLSLVKFDFTLRNPMPAKHPGGIWDLGDPNSYYFKDLSLNFALDEIREYSCFWTDHWSSPLRKEESESVTIYQDSSGGENWKYRTHVNRHNEVMNSFCGYKVYGGDGEIKSGKRAEPIVAVCGKDKFMSISCPYFWQNSPKSIGVIENILTIRLFPKHYADVFELQPGEQKTHSIYIDFALFDPEKDVPLAWTYNPLNVFLSPDYYEESGAFPYFTPISEVTDDRYIELMKACVEGSNSFFAKRELIDEYGWRNFGDLYADHENLFYEGKKAKPIVSHYNNQYDAIYGFLLQFARFSDWRWWQLARDLATHVIDIDIYHTDKDKAAYNGGLFWHTDHYSDAATSSHRCYSRYTMEERGLKDYGGGPSNEHLYTTGLLYYYLFTGDVNARDSVIGLAEYVLNLDDGSKTIFRFICNSATGLASQTGSPDYHKPGRGCAYSINALIDAYLLTKKDKYIKKAEELIKRCIHPKDDLDALELVSDPEHRWFYTVFLQILGRYLDFKAEMNSFDYMFCYARQSLLHYAKWMIDNEVPFKTKLDIVEYPTETWIVMDMRKSNVFDFAAKYTDSSELRKKFLERAEFFYNTCMDDLQEFETKYFTRPLVMLMSYGVMRDYFRKYEVVFDYDIDCSQYDFGNPIEFIPQKARAIKRAQRLALSLFIIILFFLILYLLI